MQSRSRDLANSMSSVHPLRRTYRLGRVISLAIVICLLSYLTGALALELDISADRNGRAISVGELVCYLGAFVIAGEICRPPGPWESGWQRFNQRVAVNASILVLGSLASSLVCGYALVSGVAPGIRWWVPLVNVLALTSLLLLSSRVLPTPYFMSVPFTLLAAVLISQMIDIPGANYVLLAGYSPNDSPDAMYWMAGVVILWVLNLAPLYRVGRFLRSTGYVAEG